MSATPRPWKKERGCRVTLAIVMACIIVAGLFLEWGARK